MNDKEFDVALDHLHSEVKDVKERIAECRGQMSEIQSMLQAIADKVNPDAKYAQKTAFFMPFSHKYDVMDDVNGDIYRLTKKDE